MVGEPIRVDAEQVVIANQCLESEMNSIEGIVGRLDAMNAKLSDSWEGETASRAFGVFTRAITAALLAQKEARGYCDAVQAGVQTLEEADRGRAQVLQLQEDAPYAGKREQLKANKDERK